MRATSSLKKHFPTIGTLLLAFALLPLAMASAQFNINDAFVANEQASGAISFAGPFGGTISLGYNFTPGTPGSLATTGLVHTDSWAGSPSLQGWYYPNGVIVPAMVVNTTATAVDTGFAVTGPRQMHLHPGHPSANGFQEPSGWAVVRYTVATSGTDRKSVV